MSRTPKPSLRMPSIAVLAFAFSVVCSTCQAQTHVNKTSQTQSSRVFGYTDESGVTCLTNVAPSAHERLNFEVVVEADAAHGPVASLPASQQLRDWVEDAAQREHVDSALIYAVMAVESGFNANAVSARGAAGLMQLMPTTASFYGVTDRLDGHSSVLGGTRYLHDLLGRFDNNLTLALAAYNSGENAVHQYHDRIPPYAETQSYVPHVLALYNKLKSQ